MNLQEASKFARHSKRTRLSTDDINNALKMRNVEVRSCTRFANQMALRENVWVSERALAQYCLITIELCLTCLQPTYGFASKDPKRFVKAANHNDLFYVEDPVLSLDEVSPTFSQLPSCALCQDQQLLLHKGRAARSALCIDAATLQCCYQPNPKYLSSNPPSVGPPALQLICKC